MLNAKPFFGVDVDDVWNMVLSQNLESIKPQLQIPQLSAGSEAHVV